MNARLTEEERHIDNMLWDYTKKMEEKKRKEDIAMEELKREITAFTTFRETEYANALIVIKKEEAWRKYITTKIETMETAQKTYIEISGSKTRIFK